MSVYKATYHYMETNPGVAKPRDFLVEANSFYNAVELAQSHLSEDAPDIPVKYLVGVVLVGEVTCRSEKKS